MLCAKAEAKIEAASKKKKNAKKDLELLTKFRGDSPPSLTRVMTGEVQPEGVGFHHIALQVAITANALGKTEDAVLAVCEGLLANHVSNGTRYNSPAKRRAGLSRLPEYTAGNPCYECGRDAVRPLLPEPAPNLDGLTQAQLGEIRANLMPRGTPQYRAHAGCYRANERNQPAPWRLCWAPSTIHLHPSARLQAPTTSRARGDGPA